MHQASAQNGKGSIFFLCQSKPFLRKKGLKYQLFYVSVFCPDMWSQTLRMSLSWCPQIWSSASCSLTITPASHGQAYPTLPTPPIPPAKRVPRCTLCLPLTDRTAAVRAERRVKNRSRCHLCVLCAFDLHVKCFYTWPVFLGVCIRVQAVMTDAM